ncbi:MAG: two-component system sensor histidine kinase KdpD [Pedosphaera sp.]|nr:two-component system sensor histidine kinase KdpD [Pedosphaera sp.]
MTDISQPGFGPAPLAAPGAEPQVKRGKKAFFSRLARGRSRPTQPMPEGAALPQYLTAVGVVLLVVLSSTLLRRVVGYQSIALIFLLAVVVLALFVGRGPSLVAAALSALLWNFYFLTPLHVLRITYAQDSLLFGVYFVVALILGQLTARIRAQSRAERQREERATALFHLTRELAEATHRDAMLETVVQQMERAFKAKVAVLLPDPKEQFGQKLYPASSLKLSEQEQCIAAWVFEHGEAAGKFTRNLPLAEAIHVPLITSGRTVGVMGLRLEQTFAPAPYQRNLLDACAQQIALALDRHRLRMISENTQLIAASERLSKTLLDSMSHEIRTPIAAIQSATTHLVEDGDNVLSKPQLAMVGEIQEATERLNRLVGKVLDMTRLESGSVKPKLDLCDVGDLVHVAAKECRKELAQHKLTIQMAAGLTLVEMDYVLTLEALRNLLSNAAFHTPPGTDVQLSAQIENGMLVLAVADRGPGIDAESMPRIFDKFYRAPNARTGGTGLGLSLVKGFVEAQGGRLNAANRPEGGAVFTVRMPLGR